MNKGELIQVVAEKSGNDIQSKAAAERIVNLVFDEMKASLKNGEEVRIDKFGTFTVAKRAARKGVNPQTGETIKIKASKTVKFKPATALKDVAAKAKV